MMWRKVKQFIQESAEELRKMTWSPWQELWATTWIVIFFVLIVGIYLVFVDRIFALFITRLVR